MSTTTTISEENNAIHKTVKTFLKEHGKTYHRVYRNPFKVKNSKFNIFGNSIKYYGLKLKKDQLKSLNLILESLNVKAVVLTSGFMYPIYSLKIEKL